MNKLKILSIAVCCLLSALWSEAQCMDDPINRDEKKTPLYIPILAKGGHEETYKRFYNGVLIYRPNPTSPDRQIKLPVASLEYPLNGTFDLSKCGDMGQYLSISTGYRKKKNPENAGKLEIW